MCLALFLRRPNIEYFCDMHYDPFLLMQDHGKVYGSSNSSLVLTGIVYGVVGSDRAVLFGIRVYDFVDRVERDYNDALGYG